MPGKTPVIDVGGCNCTALRKATRRLSQFYDSAIAASGLRSTQYAILTEIGRRPDEPPTLRELAQALVMDQSTVSQNLRPLEREGLVALVRDTADRRRRNVTMTDAGRARLADARPLWRVAQTRFEDVFGSRQAEALRETLFAIARNPAFVGEGSPSDGL
jgi:DNA-binding MarR family transcriptional regulator